MARQAATELSGETNYPDVYFRVLLLRDIKSLWPDGTPFLATADLRRRLNELDEQPWPTWSRGHEMTARGLASLLKEFDIKPTSDGQLRGYRREDLVAMRDEVAKKLKPEQRVDAERRAAEFFDAPPKENLRSS